MDGLKPKKIGILGGTFDPVHYGHLLIAQSALEEFDLDQMVFLPTGKSPHKAFGQVTDPRLRCAMVQAAIHDNENFVLSDIEAGSEEINYTYRTLQHLHQIYSDARLHFVMGEDSMDEFGSWKNPQEICRLATLLVAVRNDSGSGIEEKIKEFADRYGTDAHMLHAPNFSVSSREIRKRVRMGKSVQYMIPKEVQLFIEEHSLYIE